jgi:hypothetical protein
MTTIFTDDGPGPRTHALVLGVGNYPYCDPNRFDRPRERQLALPLGPRTSPPASARRFAEWLIAEQAGNPVAPLGSVELLASNSPNADAPTFGAVKTAFRQWYARCDADPDSVAMFFFSGHGCEQHDQLVLLEDVGEDPENFFANAIKVSELVAGMARNSAGAQCFFVDACRTVPDGVLTMTDVRTNSLIQPDIRRPQRDRAVIFSTSHDRPAYGRADGVTLFTELLIAALDGAAARKQRNGIWEIKLNQLSVAVNALLEWHGIDDQDCESSAKTKVIRQLPTRPRVPFRFGCEPPEALRHADLSLIGHDTSARFERAPEAALWEGDAPAAHFDLHARFTDGCFADTSGRVCIFPPCVEEDLAVFPGGAGRANC